MTRNEPLVFLSCGGTIEKVALPGAQELGFDRSRVSDWAKACRITQPWRTETVMLIDSLEMTAGHRQQLADKIAATPEHQIVVLHGTDTMVNSATTIMLHRRDDQVIVLTGAMVPASQDSAEAMFNFGLATAAVQALSPGVYIAMSGRIFDANKTRKNLEMGIFEPTEPEFTAGADQEDDALENPTNGTLRITKRKITGFFR